MLVEKCIYGMVEVVIWLSFVVFFNCKNVFYEGFMIGGGLNWMIYLIYCENIVICCVNVDMDGLNNDGVDFDLCWNLLIEYCIFSMGDDCVVLKLGYNEDGWCVNWLMENVVMWYCFSKCGYGGLVIGSEMLGSVCNVYMYDCEFDGMDCVVCIKLWWDCGGVVENVWVENL